MEIIDREILYYVSLVGIAMLTLLLVVFVVYFWRRLIKERFVFYKGYDLRPRVFLKLRRKWSSCGEGMPFILIARILMIVLCAPFET
jgi:hypothetical protein